MAADGASFADRDLADAADHRLAAALATEAGANLLALLQRHGETGGSSEAGLATLRDEGDRVAHEFLAETLAEARPDDAVLSEEAPDDRRRLGYRRVWIVDPLDGTRQYGEPHRTDWAVHVALVIGGVPVVGAVALPAEGVTYATPDPALPAERRPPTDPSQPSPRTDPAAPATERGGGEFRCRVVASRSRPNPLARVIAAVLGGELYTIGSVGAKVAEVVRGRADAYVHSGGHHEWDSAAPVAVARAAGLHASRLGGGPLRYNQPDPFVPDILVCRPEIAGDIVAAYAALESSARSGDPRSGTAAPGAWQDSGPGAPPQGRS